MAAPFNLDAFSILFNVFPLVVSLNIIMSYKTSLSNREIKHLMIFSNSYCKNVYDNWIALDLSESHLKTPFSNT